MLADYGLLQQLEHYAFSRAVEPMALYGDPAYPLRVHLQVPYRCAGMTPRMEEYNKAMSAVRISVEWLFGDIINYFKFLDFKKNLKISLSAVGKMYMACAILRNALTCMYGNSTSEFFALNPPSVRDYFNWMLFYSYLGRDVVHRYESLKSKFSLILFVNKLMNGCS